MIRELEVWRPPKTITDTKSGQIYKVGILLGKGSFGTCYKMTPDCYGIATSRLRTGCETSQEIACKIVKKRPPMDMLEADWTQKIKREIYIHSSLSHENIVRFLSRVQDKVNHYLLLELCANKSLSEMQKRRGTITELEARYYMKQINSGVRYLHERNIIHRDLKPGNIFIHKTMTIKIGDFGLSSRVKDCFDKRKTMCGTRNYVAPEMLDNQGHGLEVDIWAIGCILYNFLVGRPPFSSQGQGQTMKPIRIRRAQVVFPHQVSSAAEKFISELLKRDPNLRPTPIEIINSDFMKCGPTIPKTLPESALTTEPRFDIENELAPVMLPTLRLGLGNLVDTCPHHYTAEQIEALPSLMKYLQEDIKNALGSKLHPSSDRGTESPKSVPLLWIVKWWARWETEFGFAYQLSDGSAGMSFNDNSRMMLLNDDVTLQYVDIGANREHCYTHTVSPYELGKKVRVFNACLQHMNQQLATAVGRMDQDPNVSLMTRLPSIHKWFHSTQSTVMLLTNGTLQINNRVNHKKMILCPHLGTITVLNRSRAVDPVMETFKLSKIEKRGCTLELRQDLQYSLEKIEVLLRLHLPQNLLAQG